MTANAEAVRDEWSGVLGEATGVLIAAIASVHHFHSYVLEVTANEDPAKIMHFGIGDPKGPEAQAFGGWPMGSLDERLGNGGQVEASIGQQWIVYVYGQWEHVYRPMLAKALEVEASNVTDPLMGDLRALRNDVVHHRGIATRGNSAGNQTLQWFEEGDVIVMTDERITEFMRLVGLGRHPGPGDWELQ